MIFWCTKKVGNAPRRGERAIQSENVRFVEARRRVGGRGDAEAAVIRPLGNFDFWLREASVYSCKIATALRRKLCFRKS